MKNKIFISFVTFCLLFVLSSVVTPLGDTIISTLIPPFPRDATKFLNGDAQWTVPAGSGSVPTGTVVSTGTPVNGALMIYDGTSGTNAKPAGITTGSSTNLTVPGTFTGDVIQATKAFRPYQGTLTHAGTVTLDFDGTTTVNALSITGNVTFATSNLATNRTYRLKILGTSTNATPTFPAWHFMTGAPGSISAGKISTLNLEAWGFSDTLVLAWFQEEP